MGASRTIRQSGTGGEERIMTNPARGRVHRSGSRRSLGPAVRSVAVVALAVAALAPATAKAHPGPAAVATATATAAAAPRPRPVAWARLRLPRQALAPRPA